MYLLQRVHQGNVWKNSICLLLQRVVHAKITSWKLTHPQTIQDEHELIFHLNGAGEIYHYITGSPVNPLLWMGAVRMREQTLTGGLEWCGLLWCFHQLFSHSDGTHSLQRIHWWASDVTLIVLFCLRKSNNDLIVVKLFQSFWVIYSFSNTLFSFLRYWKKWMSNRRWASASCTENQTRPELWFETISVNRNRNIVILILLSVCWFILYRHDHVVMVTFVPIIVTLDLLLH